MKTIILEEAIPKLIIVISIAWSLALSKKEILKFVLKKKYGIKAFDKNKNSEDGKRND